jgi:hypothetical protein
METDTIAINFDGLLDKLRRCGLVPNLVSTVLPRGGHVGAGFLSTFDPTVPKPPAGFGSPHFRHVEWGKYTLRADLDRGGFLSRATGASGADVLELWLLIAAEN